MTDSIEEVMASAGVNRRTALFILALESGETTGDVITPHRRETKALPQALEPWAEADQDADAEDLGAEVIAAAAESRTSELKAILEAKVE